MDKLTATNLKNILWETLNDIRSGKKEPAEADSIAVQSREILRTTSIQLQIARQSKRDLPVEVIAFSEDK